MLPASSSGTARCLVRGPRSQPGLDRFRLIQGLVLFKILNENKKFEFFLEGVLLLRTGTPRSQEPSVSFLRGLNRKLKNETLQFKSGRPSSREPGRPRRSLPRNYMIAMTQTLPSSSLRTRSEGRRLPR